MKRIWMVNVTLPGLDCSPDFFLSREPPTEEQVCTALDLAPRSPGSPDEPGIGQAEKMRRLYPGIRIKEVHPVELD